VAEQWKLGRGRSAATGGRSVDDGVLVVVAKNDRRVRIEVGYGLEGAIPDALAKRIVAETITPRLPPGRLRRRPAGRHRRHRPPDRRRALPEPWQPGGAAGQGGARGEGDAGWLPLLLVGFFSAWC
jgi:uncharacterized protein